MTYWSDSLKDTLAHVYRVDDEESRAGFVFDNDSKANWGLRMLADAQHQRDEIKQLADDERERIADWEESRLAIVTRDQRFFEGALADYWRRQLEPEVARLMDQGLSFEDAWAKLPAKSRSLPCGTLQASKGRRRVVLEDPSSFLAWAKEHGRDDLVTIAPPVPAKAALADLPTQDGVVLVDGEKVPGVRVETGPVTYRVELKL